MQEGKRALVFLCMEGERPAACGAGLRYAASTAAAITTTATAARSLDCLLLLSRKRPPQQQQHQQRTLRFPFSPSSRFHWLFYFARLCRSVRCRRRRRRRRLNLTHSF